MGTNAKCAIAGTTIVLGLKRLNRSVWIQAQDFEGKKNEHIKKGDVSNSRGGRRNGTHTFKTHLQIYKIFRYLMRGCSGGNAGEWRSEHLMGSVEIQYNFRHLRPARKRLADQVTRVVEEDEDDWEPVADVEGMALQ